MSKDKADLVAQVQMLIRVTPQQAYEAFVDPAVTTRFWFTRSEGRLTVGQTVRWFWDMYAVSAPVTPLALAAGERILIEWGEADQTTQVEWLFEPHGEQATLVKITHSGLSGSQDEIVAQAIDSKGGFSMVLANAKAWLEHGIDLGLIRDQHPVED
jgi:uncharacterized protein YndB with AHSA1/START domain